VEPRDPVALADALQRLAGDPALAKQLAEAGRRHVLDHFDLQTCLAPLIERFRAKLQTAPRLRGKPETLP
jgi:colanic acid/amylovoran biosynthesis glycosyltransferase